jgi:hypothetical protein
MSKKTKQVITDDDLKFKHFALAKEIAVNMLEVMKEKGLGKEEVPQVLNDVCKVIVLNEAVVDKGGALTVVQRFVELSKDLTLLMMRIVMGQVKVEK